MGCDHERFAKTAVLRHFSRMRPFEGAISTCFENILLLILFQAMFDIWSAEGALAPRLPQARCPGLWPHAHCSMPAAGERMIEGPLRGTWVPGSAGADLAGNRAQWQSTLCCGGKFPSVKMPWIVRAHARKSVCAGVRRWCLQSS